jgi:hypothetical protein
MSLISRVRALQVLRQVEQEDGASTGTGKLPSASACRAFEAEDEEDEFDRAAVESLQLLNCKLKPGSSTQVRQHLAADDSARLACAACTSDACTTPCCATQGGSMLLHASVSVHVQLDEQYYWCYTARAEWDCLLQIADGNVYDRFVSIDDGRHADDGVLPDASASARADDGPSASAAPPVAPAAAEETASASAQQPEPMKHTGTHGAPEAGASQPSSAADGATAAAAEAPAERQRARKGAKRVRFRDEPVLIHYDAGPSDDETDDEPAIFRKVTHSTEELMGALSSSDDDEELGEEEQGGVEGAGAATAGSKEADAGASTSAAAPAAAGQVCCGLMTVASLLR